MDTQVYQNRKATRKLLWSWGNYTNKINRLEEERKCAQRWADDARDTLRAQNLTGMPRGGQKSDLSDVIVTVARMQQNYQNLLLQIDTEIADLICLRNCIEELVSRLTPIQEKIITYRYVDGHSWRYIAMKTGYDERQARRIEGQAVDFIAQHVIVQNET